MSKIIFILVSLSVWLLALPSDIEYFINKSKLPRKDISIYIEELESNRVVASLNADMIRKPASVIKVLTGYATLLQLGFDYRWPTEFYGRGEDLVVKGYGDPSLNSEDLPDIVAELRRRGIREIGDILIDRSYFNIEDKDSAYFDNNPYSPYNAMPDAMMFNERVSTVCITPRSQSAYKEINDPSYKLVNNVKFVNRSCKGRYSWAAAKVDIVDPMPRLTLKGELSRHCGERKVCMIVGKPYKAFFYALKEELEKEGIIVKGKLKLTKVPSGSKLLFTHYSEPLEEIIAKTLKESNNVYARHLMLLAGAKVYGAPATLEKGRKAIESLLEKEGVLRSGTLYIDNGSGLSRKSKMPAKILGDVLGDAYDKYGQQWMETLSVAGKNGTIKARFRYTPAQNRAWMKTGTIKYVKNIGGYVKNKGGNIYSVVILVNTKSGTYRGTALQNDIINWLAQTSKMPTENYNPKHSRPLKQTKVQKQSTPPAKSINHNDAGPASNGLYYIQVASAVNEPSQNYLSRLSQAGYTYKVVHDQRYKVLIGGYPSKQAAQKELPRIRQRLSKGAFIVKR